jgi:uncharacterized protein YllA (UPF0747 family)
VEERDQYLESIKDKEVSELFSTLKSQLFKQYELIEMKTNQLDRSLLPLVKKNETYLLKQIGFMESKLEESVKSKFNVILSKYNRIDLSLRPDGFPQERVWNIFYYLNLYGTSFIKELMELEFVFDGKHKVIKL